ncbi:hypothetical protein NOR51B_1416 [Luminiphilus syltensis NOR5-1B]|uniref:Signaling modulator of AmpD, AmpE n=1 Tax=Luminiphilus syltensis NOR5-1B TaxID=565045 RepID=B8KQN9_9GAMM|nr:regulatory signaling modulator protein AmpE [Luminiphilus syltensis]EED35470.1 hypothetical protein NOR51B_1416 [Luminiphilus syltensis NOR5-1B]
MSYLAFIVATGFLVLLGPGGPLHSDGWFRSLQARVDALEPDLWFGFFLMVVAPCVGFAVLYAIVDGVFGDAAMLLLGTPALFFSFGRNDLPTLLERFLARARNGDNEGAAWVLTEAGIESEADGIDEFARVAARATLYEAYQRWFPPVFYFLLLGPLGAVAYRLMQLSVNDRRVPVGSLRHLADWLPSRMLLLTFAIIGRFDRVRPVLTEYALDPDIETDELLFLAAEAAFDVDNEADPAGQVTVVQDATRRSMTVWVVVISILAIIA